MNSKLQEIFGEEEMLFFRVKKFQNIWNFHR